MFNVQYTYIFVCHVINYYFMLSNFFLVILLRLNLVAFKYNHRALRIDRECSLNLKVMEENLQIYTLSVCTRESGKFVSTKVLCFLCGGETLLVGGDGQMCGYGVVFWKSLHHGDLMFCSPFNFIIGFCFWRSFIGVCTALKSIILLYFTFSNLKLQPPTYHPPPFLENLSNTLSK